jgi:FkbM family methyltransferase
MAKEAVLWSIGRGLRPPQTMLERMNELSYLKALIDELKIDCVLDVGANCGQFAGELRRIGYCGPIVSFEPVPAVFRTLSERFSNDPNWRGYQLALGSTDEWKAMTVWSFTPMSSLLDAIEPEEGNTQEIVQIRRLDGMVAEPELRELQGRRVFLKMDTQGYDLEVFRGAAGCRHIIYGMQSEISVKPVYHGMPHYLAALQEYEAAGFDLHNLSVVSRNGNGSLVEMNCFMRRSGRQSGETPDS